MIKFFKRQYLNNNREKIMDMIRELYNNWEIWEKELVDTFFYHFVKS